MNPSAVLRQTGHRAWPPPAGPWIMTQIWHELLFAHWPLPPGDLRPLVPAVLPLDTFDGQAWLGVVPFRMSYVRPRGVPPMPGISAFPELNVRTYVTLGGKPGVYFFSLDAGSRLAVAIARATYHLPYMRAEMRCERTGDTVTYTSRRVQSDEPPAVLDVTYRPAGPVFTAEPGSLDAWLTERYCLYAVTPAGRVYRGEIHHGPWPLQPAEAEMCTNTMAAAGLTLPNTPPRLAYAHRQEVLIWPIHRVVQ